MAIVSTRNFDRDGVNFSHAVTNAQPEDKGLWFRDSLPSLGSDFVNECTSRIKSAIAENPNMNLKTTIMDLFVKLWKQFDVDLTDDEIKQSVSNLDKFLSPYIIPIDLIQKDYGLCIINESYGPTNAFKDLALVMVTHMVSLIVKKKNNIAIENALNGIKGQKLTFVISQTSTSGDTGPAGGAGIEGKDFIINVIGFPAYEATYSQAGQMIGLGNNVFSIPMKQAFTAIQEFMKDGNTSEYRDGIKKILEEEFKDLIEKYGFEIDVLAGSFNSVNIGRIDAQSIYHTIGVMIADAKGLVGEYGVNEAIPSGNFGHAFGVLQAKKMLGGNKIGKIIVSTNENDAIYRLIKYGKYKKAQDEIHCPSVSMIIKFGSNVERMFSTLFGDARTKQIMAQFESGEEVVLSEKEHKDLIAVGFVTYCVDTEEELLTMREVWLETGRLICPHTANAYFAAKCYHEDFPEDKRKIMISETASPWKFMAATAASLNCGDRSKIKEIYEQFREKEKTKEGIGELIEIMKQAYKDNGREFDEQIIPPNLRKIYKDGFEMPTIQDAQDFAQLTTNCVKKYSTRFKEQIVKLGKSIDPNF